MTEIIPIATCPACGERDQADIINHPAGTYWCGRCNLVYSGGRAEWEHGRLGEHSLRDWRRHGGQHPPHTEDAM